ncbi:hypothetical protein [Arthrobacter sp. NQ4]|uniref:hypothetical protein n=1 Tax=Arthrobacter sp. NQ4 TaxID=3027930 RepID=UPI0023AE8F32|nr:hypothetical protein [Arthrobacter sp. NQ4]MDE8585896.1 hypothetical protein [Arthrobacter sp. NQ4]
MTSMHLEKYWHRLSPASKQWLLDNPGCVILPRTISAEINAESGEDADSDSHGETVLSPENIEFIRSRTRQEEPSPAQPTYRFFDSVQP